MPDGDALQQSGLYPLPPAETQPGRVLLPQGAAGERERGSRDAPIHGPGSPTRYRQRSDWRLMGFLFFHCHFVT